jgi:predicted O-methyltransferase YrrM
MTTQLLDVKIDNYATQMTSPESEALSALNRETHLKTELPQMLSGHLQGSVLAMMSKMIQPLNVLELGTFTGYSAICLAQGMRDNGFLHTIDINEELSNMCEKYWEKEGVKDKIVQHIGKATDIIPNLNLMFDLVFIDADKVNYSNYYDLVFAKVNIGGYILADNVLYEGEVILPDSEQSKNAKAMHQYNQKISADNRVEQVLLPIRDGIMIARKMSN